MSTKDDKVIDFIKNENQSLMEQIQHLIKMNKNLSDTLIAFINKTNPEQLTFKNDALVGVNPLESPSGINVNLDINYIYCYHAFVIAELLKINQKYVSKIATFLEMDDNPKYSKRKSRVNKAKPLNSETLLLFNREAIIKIEHFLSHPEEYNIPKDNKVILNAVAEYKQAYLEENINKWDDSKELFKKVAVIPEDELEKII